MPTTSRSLLTLALAGAIVLLTQTGCNSLTAINMVSGSGEQQRTSDIVYDAATGLQLDVYTPKEPAGTPAPVVVFFYGGGWQRGSKDAYRFVASKLTREGFVVVVPNYRLHPTVTFPAFMYDGAKAVAWAHAHAGEYNANPNKLFVMGHSAGAHIAALLHYDERYLANAGVAPCGFVGLSGPYDFAPLMGPTLNSIFPNDKNNSSQPIGFVDGSEGPALLIHGLQDKTVKPRNSARLANAATAAGGSAELEIIEGRGHPHILLGLSRPFGYMAPVAKSTARFINQQACSPSLAN